jgi:hypothetical protein
MPLFRLTDRSEVINRWLSRLFALGLVLGCCVLQSAAEDDWLARRMARLSLESPEASYLLARSCPTPDFTAYLSFNISAAGTLLDTVGINNAPAGAWNLQIDRNGQLTFSIFSPQRRTARDTGNGWHRYTLSSALRSGQDYNCILQCSAGSLLLLITTDKSSIGRVYEELPCAVDSAAVYAGDFPGDNSWGADYNIHSSFSGTLDVLYFGPLIDALSAVNIAKTWVDPALQGLGQVSATTAEDAQDRDNTGSSSPTNSEPSDALFTLDYDLAASDKSHYTKGDCVEALLTASPLYGGAAVGPGLRTGEIDRLRQAKVEELVALAGKLEAGVVQLQPGLRELQAAYAKFLQVALKRDPTLDSYVCYTLRELAGFEEKLKRAQTQLPKLAQRSTDPLTDANAQYVRLVQATLLGATCLEQADSLLLYAVMPLSEFTKSADPALAQAAAQLDQAMQQYDKLSPQLGQLAHHMAGVDFGLQQLAAADYYVGEAGLAFMAQQLPELQRQLASAAPRRGVSAEQLAQARSTLRYNQLMHDVLAENLARAPKPQLIAKANGPAAAGQANVPGLLRAALYVLGPQPAWAEQETPPATKAPIIKQIAGSLQNLREFADLPKDPEKSTYWDSVKEDYRQASNDITKIMDVGNTRMSWAKAIGKSVDDVGAFAHAVAREGFGLYYGNTMEEVATDVVDNYKQVLANHSKNSEGTETYRTAKAGMESAENLADQAAKDFIANTLGGNLAPWVAGKVAKGLTSVFTGLAKGIYAVADPTSTDAELAVGIAEIVLADTADNRVAYARSMEGFKALLTKALGTGSMKECLNVVLDQYKEDLGKEVLGNVTDGKTVLDAFMTFIGVDPKLLEEFSYDGNYVGKIAGDAYGTIAFTIQGTTWQGSISGSIPWTMEGTEISGVMEFKGSLFGSFDPASGVLSGEVSGTAGTNGNRRFNGPLSGSVVRGVGEAFSASGKWQAGDKDETLGGSWSATR